MHQWRASGLRQSGCNDQGVVEVEDLGAMQRPRVVKRSTFIFDQKYGRRYVVRAITTAPSRAASSEKDQTLLVPSAPRTYVRTLVSANRDNHGTDRDLGRATRM